MLDRLVADHPDFVFHHLDTALEHQTRRRRMPGTYVGIWKTFARQGIPVLAMRDTLAGGGRQIPFIPADCLAKGGDAVSCGRKRSEVLVDRNPTLDFVGRFPNLKPLDDMSAAVCRRLLPGGQGNVLVYRDSHHITAAYMRTMIPELGPADGQRDRLVVTVRPRCGVSHERSGGADHRPAVRMPSHAPIRSSHVSP